MMTAYTVSHNGYLYSNASNPEDVSHRVERISPVAHDPADFDALPGSPASRGKIYNSSLTRTGTSSLANL